jgi:ParB/RepB/Spo0J family partition protein
MNAPATPAAVEAITKAAKYDLVELADIELSKTPMQILRRERFNKDAMKELTASIKADGVLQPILLRRRGANAKHELVAGERRYLASKAAGLTVIPALLRDLTDLQVVSMQVTENNQREDLHKLVEAEGFEVLMKAHKLNADQIAEKIGKSRSYVYGVLKYCDLCPEARRAFFDGKLDSSRALLIARIGHHDHQRQAMKEVLDDEMTFREAHRFILDNFMLKLKEAPFDINDAQLLPKAGTCQACPKRTGNQQDLFGDVKNADVCTDGKCFDDKRQAHYATARKELEAKGAKVIAGADAKKLIPRWEDGSDWLQGAYVKLDDTEYIGGKYQKVSAALGQDFKPTLVQHPLNGKIIKVASRQQVAAASGKKSSTSSSRYGLTAPKKPAGPDIDDVEMERLVALIHKNAPKAFGKPFMHALVKEIIGNYGAIRNGHDAIAKAWGWTGKPFGGGGDRKMPKEALKLGDRDLILLMIETIFVSEYQRDHWLKLFGINGKEVREQIIEDRKKAAATARAEAKAKKDAKAAKAKPAGTAIAQAMTKAKAKKK